MGDLMERRILAGLCALLLILSGGCAGKKIKKEKLRDISFTVVTKEEIPEELAEMIQEKGVRPFKLTFQDQGMLYIAVGYGKQETSGHSIHVKDCYETPNAVYIHTNLIGPSPKEKSMEAETTPYIVVKMENIEKIVVFQ